jgi:hypothetical protein
LVPSLKIFRKFCSSSEKTVLFIVSVLRLFIVYRIFEYLNKMGYAKLYEGGPAQIFLFFLCISYILINIVYIIVIFWKVTEYDQVELDREVDDIAVALAENPVPGLPGLVPETVSEQEQNSVLGQKTVSESI